MEQMVDEAKLISLRNFKLSRSGCHENPED